MHTFSKKYIFIIIPNYTASLISVEAPKGTDDITIVSSFKTISTSKLGFPLESNISLPINSQISAPPLKNYLNF